MGGAAVPDDNVAIGSALYISSSSSSEEWLPSLPQSNSNGGAKFCTCDEERGGENAIIPRESEDDDEDFDIGFAFSLPFVSWKFVV